jgi:hypothetical protein
MCTMTQALGAHCRQDLYHALDFMPSDVAMRTRMDSRVRLTEAPNGPLGRVIPAQFGLLAPRARSHLLKARGGFVNDTFGRYEVPRSVKEIKECR